MTLFDGTGCVLKRTTDSREPVAKPLGGCIKYTRFRLAFAMTLAPVLQSTCACTVMCTGGPKVQSGCGAFSVCMDYSCRFSVFEFIATSVFCTASATQLRARSLVTHRSLLPQCTAAIACLTAPLHFDVQAQPRYSRPISTTTFWTVQF